MDASERRFLELSNADPMTIADEERSELLTLCSEMAKSHHRECENITARAVERAFDAGRYLEAARKFLPRRGSWGEWLKKNFNGSERTANLYRFIFRHWDCEEMVEARRVDGGLTSIRHAQRIIKGKMTEADNLNFLDSMAKTIVTSLEKFLDRCSDEKVKALCDWMRNNGGTYQEVEWGWSISEWEYLFSEALGIDREKDIEKVPREKMKMYVEDALQDHPVTNGVSNGEASQAKEKDASTEKVYD